MHVSTKTSSHARWQALPLKHISVSDGFWAQRQATNRNVSIRHGYRKLEEFGNFHNLRLAAHLTEGDYRGPVFMDSDVYKWLEAVGYALADAPDAELEAMAGQAIDLLAAAQAEDGYLNSYWQAVKPDERWMDLDHGHELYAAGHLFEAAVAFHRATGDARLLRIARRFADCIASTFGPGRRAGTPGHPEIELALVELYRETGERRYLDLAGFFVDQRGQARLRGYGRYGPEYHQDHIPVREATEVVGHAVRQLYLTAGVTDLYLETGEGALLAAMERLWADMATRKTHLTAGFGARFTGESFGDAYELPSDRCYCETCASIAGMMWNWRMLLATGAARYADLLERSLYNGFLSGVSLDGTRYFYVNPLQSQGGIERPEWYGCACCPPNVMRQIALVGHYAASVDGGGIQVHQYMPLVIDAEMPDGPRAVLRVETDYPWRGQVKVTVEQADGSLWALSLRVPGWCQGARLQVNGEVSGTTPVPGSYIAVERNWRAGDGVELDLPLEPRLTQAHPRVDAIRCSLAIERGPLVYCLEEADQEAGVNLLDVRLNPTAPLREAWRGDLLGGVMTIETRGTVVNTDDWKGHLYHPATRGELPQRETTLTAVPYYAWANRGAGAMRVWIPVSTPV